MRLFPILILSVLILPAALYGMVADTSSASTTRQFDFWVGTWDLTWQNKDGKTIQGTNHVTTVLGGKVIHEHFTDPSTGFEGMSYTVFDVRTDQWKQTWVDNTGGYLDFVGGMEDDRMILHRSFTTDDTTVHQRMVYYDIADAHLKWNWERSDDGGKSWKPLWQIHYSRQK